MIATLRTFALVLAFTGSCSAQAMLINLTATLEGAQEVPGVTTSANGSATLVLDTEAETLGYAIALSGLDIDGSQTGGNNADNVVGVHFHRAPAGTNGAMTFGVYLPSHDADLMIDPVLGTLSGIWDMSDVGALQSIADSMGDLIAGNFYINVHTVAFPAGEIRGQVLRANGSEIPLPTPLALMLLGLFCLRRSGKPI
jgi:hypothetical protein